MSQGYYTYGLVLTYILFISVKSEKIFGFKLKNIYQKMLLLNKSASLTLNVARISNTTIAAIADRLLFVSNVIS